MKFNPMLFFLGFGGCKKGSSVVHFCEGTITHLELKNIELCKNAADTILGHIIPSVTVTSKLKATWNFYGGETGCFKIPGPSATLEISGKLKKP